MQPVIWSLHPMQPVIWSHHRIQRLDRLNGPPGSRAAASSFFGAVATKPPCPPPRASEKSWPAFSAAAGRFLRFPIGDRRGTRMRASASKRPVTRAQVYKRDSSGVAPASPQVAFTASPRARPKKSWRIFGPRPPRTGEGRKRAKERGVRFGRPRKMTPHQRQEALQRLAAGETQADVARTYAVDAATISRLAASSPFEQGAVGPPPARARLSRLGRALPGAC